MSAIERLEEAMDKLLDDPLIRDYFAAEQNDEDRLALLALGLEMRIKLNETAFVTALAAYTLVQRAKQLSEERVVVA